ncbi:hypothetical protein AAVH_13970 [Aphelenchoides avenae]|nr:hypothetical protein AAVH_13970 [Aphelenchus avenae]
MSTTARVTLEGKSRLPVKVQEAVIDIGNAVASTANASGSAETLGTLIRNYVGLDATIENSASNLAKLGAITDRLQAQAPTH